MTTTADRYGLQVDFKSRRNHPMTLLNDEEIKTQLMNQDPEFRRLAIQHSDYSRLLHELESKTHLSEAELAEEARLKRIKLALKDHMQELMSQFAAQPV
jgi:uncharacterized protein YdcH (DUF465 family)